MGTSGVTLNNDAIKLDILNSDHCTLANLSTVPSI